MEQLDICVTRTIDSGVVPIELRFTPIYDCLFSNVAGFRGQVSVNSVLYGVLTPQDYLPALEEDRELATAFTARSLRAVLSTLSRLRPETRDLSCITIRCPMTLVKKGALPAEPARILRGAEPRHAAMICLTFGQELLHLPKKTLGDVLLYIRSLGCKVAVEGYGREDFPMTALPYGVPDLLIMTEPAAPGEDDARLAAYVSFAKSLGAQVLAEGVGTEGRLRQLNSAQCDVYTPARGLRVNGQGMYAQKELAQLLTERGLANVAGSN